MALPQDKTPIAFTRRDGQRIRSAVLAHERGYQNEAPPRGVHRGAKTFLAVGQVGAGGITALAGSVAGSGSVELCNVADDGTITPGGTTITVRNLGGAIAAGRYVLLDDGPHGKWVVVEKC